MTEQGQKPQGLQHQPTEVLVNRMFSTALDAHAEEFYTNTNEFSIYEYNRQRGLYQDLTDENDYDIN